MAKAVDNGSIDNTLNLGSCPTLDNVSRHKMLKLPGNLAKLFTTCFSS